VGAPSSQETQFSLLLIVSENWPKNWLLVPRFVQITLGDHNISSISLNKTEKFDIVPNENIEIHPLFDLDTLQNDISKLHLDNPIDLVQNPHIMPICLPTNADERYNGRNAKATGWGLTKRHNAAEVLQEINIRIISMGVCNQHLSDFRTSTTTTSTTTTSTTTTSTTTTSTTTIQLLPLPLLPLQLLHLPLLPLPQLPLPLLPEKVMCALGDGPRQEDTTRICRGDSGGPVTVEQRRLSGDSGPIRRELVGVISETGAKDCSQNVPDKFTAVAKYLDWINSKGSSTSSGSTTASSSVKGPEWVGQCIKDRRSRVLPVKFGETDLNSPEYCIKKCKSHEYSFAGVEYANECFCGNTPPAEEDLTKDSACNQKCPGDSSKICGASWRMNVYETGYESGLAMIPGRSCDCSYSLGGCKITSAPPVGFACECKYQGYWTCGAQLRKCETDEDCPGHCTDKTCCRRGGGDCGGYWG